jgi:SAM-dependent methyltransferase
MPEAIVTALSALIHRHPWWKARARLVVAILERHGISAPARVLDAGCGWGVTLEALENRGFQVSGLDVSRQALEQLDRPDRRLIEADLAQPISAAAVVQSAYDAVLALDVIEHLDDDGAALANLGRLVRPGGLVIVSVPALPDLFSEFDQVQGHRRRYEPDRFIRAFEGTALVLDQVIWWGSWLEPLLRARRGRFDRHVDQPPEATYVRHLTLPPWPLPWLFRIAFACEHGRAICGKLKRGTSLIAVARPTRHPVTGGTKPVLPRSGRVAEEVDHAR